MLNKFKTRRFFRFFFLVILFVFTILRKSCARNIAMHILLTRRDVSCPAFRVHMNQQDIDRWGTASGRYSQSLIWPISSTGAIVFLDNDEMTWMRTCNSRLSDAMLCHCIPVSRALLVLACVAKAVITAVVVAVDYTLNVISKLANL
uniref:Putative histone deacetylase 4 n=1 Tax=Ixodes ricinus TaxID=34613 RepID=A0A6B0UUS8_IXORI